MNSIPLTLVKYQLTLWLKDSTPFSLKALMWPALSRSSKDSDFQAVLPGTASQARLCTVLICSASGAAFPGHSRFQINSISFFAGHDGEKLEELCSTEPK